VNLFSPGETIISINAGKFGERWVKMPREFGLNVVEMKLEWGQAPEAGRSSNSCKNIRGEGCFPDPQRDFHRGCERRQGARKCCQKNSSALVCVDGITAIGAHELRFDDWGSTPALRVLRRG